MESPGEQEERGGKRYKVRGGVKGARRLVGFNWHEEPGI